MFADYSHPIPKSRIKPIVKMENGKISGLQVPLMRSSALRTAIIGFPLWRFTASMWQDISARI